MRLPLGLFVALVLALGELALLRRRQQAAVADLADVELSGSWTGAAASSVVDVLLGLGASGSSSAGTSSSFGWLFLDARVARSGSAPHIRYRHRPDCAVIPRASRYTFE